MASIDISDAKTVPPGIEIPKALKDQFFKMHPSQTKSVKARKNVLNLSNYHYIKPHEHYSDGKNFKPKTGDKKKKEQRTLFIRGKMRKYKGRCKCGDSDCNGKQCVREQQEKQIQAKDKQAEIIKTKETKPKVQKKDEFGFGSWETVTQQEFDQQHSNEQIIKEKNTKKRWWRDQINANTSHAKRKRLMGIEKMASDEERDYDDQYCIADLIDCRKEEGDDDNMHTKFKQAADKIAISFGNKNEHVGQWVDGNAHESIDLNEEDIKIRDARNKLKAMRDNELNEQMKKKEKVIEELGVEYIVDANGKNQVDEALIIMQEIKGKNCDGVFKKKKKRKKKNRQRGNIGIEMR